MNQKTPKSNSGYGNNQEKEKSLNEYLADMESLKK